MHIFQKRNCSRKERLEMSIFFSYKLHIHIMNLRVSQVALMVKNLCAKRQKRGGFSLWVGKIPWRRARQPTPARSEETVGGDGCFRILQSVALSQCPESGERTDFFRCHEKVVAFMFGVLCKHGTGHHQFGGEHSHSCIPLFCTII